MENRYQALLQAVEAERSEEEKYHVRIKEQNSRQDKINAGIMLFPLSLERSNFTIGERIELVLFRTKHQNQNHKFKVGAACVLTLEGKPKEPYKATVAFCRKNEFRIILSGHDLSLSQFPNTAWYLLQLSYDDKPYRVMRESLHTLMKTKSIAHQELRDGVAQKDAFSFDVDTNYPYQSDILNDGQNQAIQSILKSNRIGIIHGPPGTGKTTTIVALVQALLKNEKRVLVCAPSNNAVDLLADRLDRAAVKVLRLGNVSRIDDDITHLTLDHQSRNNAEWLHIKKVKIEAEEARKSATTRKRSFGSQEREHRNMMFQEYKALKKWARDLEDRLVEQLVTSAEVIAGTLIGIDNKHIKGLIFNTVIIDEASQALEPECWHAILKAERVILVGDHLQLPPTVKSQKAKSLGLETTLLHRMTEHIKHSYLLNVQYRMHEKILSFSNKKFYEGKLESAEKVAHWTLRNDGEPLVLIDTSGCGFDEDFNAKSKSLSNEGEFFILREYLLQQSEILAGASFGVISPYAQQVRYLRAEISEDEQLKKWDIQVNTIDGFQGQEKEVICISLVRSNTQNEIGFLKDFRRLNVALTRAMKKLIIIGDFSTLSSFPLFSDLLEHVEKEGSYKSAWEFISPPSYL